MRKIQNQVIEMHGSRWKIISAKSMAHAISAISLARVRGITALQTARGTEVEADVVKLN